MITLQSRELAMFELLAPLAINIKHGNSIGQQTRPTRTADGQGEKKSRSWPGQKHMQRGEREMDRAQPCQKGKEQGTRIW